MFALDKLFTLIYVGAPGTAKSADPFVRALPYSVTLPKIPKTAEQFSRAERAAKLLCLRSQYGHFELITEGNTLPVLLGRTSLRVLKRDAPARLRAGATAHRGRRRD